MSQGPFLRKYGVQTTINFHTFEVDGVDLRKDSAPGTADLFVMKDEGAEAAATNAATDEGRGYSVVLTATEMQAARIVVYVEDQTATKVWLDTVIVIETYGNASAMHAFDLDTASVAQTGDNFARLGAPAGASVSADVADVPTISEFNARTLVAASYFDPAADAVATVTTLTNKTGFALSATGADLILQASLFALALADAVADEVLTGGTHNVNNSLGRRIRELADASLIRGADFQAGSTTTILVLDSSASTVDDFYNHTIIRIVDGAGAGQERIIADYNGTTKAATITPALVTAAPSSGDEFNIVSGGSVHAETQGGGYEGGAVWIDTADGTAGTLLYVNGTVDNPVDNIADARTLADALGMHVFACVPGASFTLAQTFNDFQFIGSGYTVALGGQDIAGCRFFNAAISGIGTGSTRAVFRECILVGTTTLAVASLLACNFSADLVLSAAAIYRISHGVHGSAASPSVDFGAAVGNTTVHIHGYNGAITIKNTGQTGTDVLHFDSPGGELTLDATCIGGTANINGTFNFVNNSSGMTINKAGAVNESIIDIQGATFSSATDSLEAIRDRGDAAWTTGAGGSDRLLLADTTIATLASQTSFTLTAGSADNDAYNNCTIVVEDVSTATQKAVGVVLDYVGSSLTVTLKEALAFTIATTDKVYILAENALKSTVANRQLDVTATGAAGIDWANVENPTTALDLSGTDIQLVDTVTTYTGNTLQTGDSFARLAAPAGASVSADIAAVKAETALIVADTNELQGDDVPGLIAALNDISAAEVNTEVDTALATTTYAEPAAVPSATASIKDKIGWIAALARNKITQTETTQTLRNDADGADIAASAVSDDLTTFVRGEYT